MIKSLVSTPAALILVIIILATNEYSISHNPNMSHNGDWFKVGLVTDPLPICRDISQVRKDVEAWMGSKYGRSQIEIEREILQENINEIPGVDCDQVWDNGGLKNV